MLFLSKNYHQWNNQETGNVAKMSTFNPWLNSFKPFILIICHSIAAFGSKEGQDGRRSFKSVKPFNEGMQLFPSHILSLILSLNLILLVQGQGIVWTWQIIWMVKENETCKSARRKRNTKISQHWKPTHDSKWAVNLFSVLSTRLFNLIVWWWGRSWSQTKLKDLQGWN